MKYDICIVGAGIVGMAHAYWAAKKGLKVIVVEKNHTCQGASIRNFGLFWDIGQEKKYKGIVADSKKVWTEFFEDTNTWHKNGGSLGLAYHNDEMQLMDEYCKLYPNKNHHILNHNDVLKKYPYVNSKNLKGALFSENEITLYSRESIPALAEWLTKKYKVEFLFDTNVISEKLPTIYTNKSSIKASKLIISTGADFELMFPDVYKNAKITKCKLQMLKTEASTTLITPALYTATSFIHYASFGKCKTLEVIRTRIKKEQPQYLNYGINLLVAQNNYNELLIGDSHEYDESVNPFNKEEIDNLFLEGIKRILPTTDINIKERWHGVYAKSSNKKFIIEEPEKNVLIVNALAGAGMTLSFGLAKKTISTFI